MTIRRRGDDRAGRRREADLSAAIDVRPEPALVDEPVVVPAQQHEVLETGLAAVLPVHDMVPIAETVAVAAGETATVVSRLQRPSHR